MLVDKIDTQGMSMPGGKVDSDQVYAPMEVKKITAFNEVERAELIDIVQEAIRTLKK